MHLQPHAHAPTRQRRMLLFQLALWANTWLGTRTARRRPVNATATHSGGGFSSCSGFSSQPADGATWRMYTLSQAPITPWHALHAEPASCGIPALAQRSRAPPSDPAPRQAIPRLTKNFGSPDRCQSVRRNTKPAASMYLKVSSLLLPSLGTCWHAAGMLSPPGCTRPHELRHA